MVEEVDAGLVERDVDTVSGVDLLNVGFVAVACGVEGGAAEGFGEVGGEANVVVRVDVVLEGVGGFGVLEDELVPALGQHENLVKAAAVFV